MSRRLNTSTSNSIRCQLLTICLPPISHPSHPHTHTHTHHPSTPPPPPSSIPAAVYQTLTHPMDPSHPQCIKKKKKRRTNKKGLSAAACCGRAVAGGQHGLPSVNRLPLIREPALWMQKPVSALVWPIYLRLCSELIHQAGNQPGPDAPQ